MSNRRRAGLRIPVKFPVEARWRIAGSALATYGERPETSPKDH